MPSFDEVTDKLPTLTIGFLALGVLLFLLATIQFRRSRSASFWLQRRRAGQRGLQVSMIAVFFLAVGAMLCVVTLVFQTVEDADSTPVPVENAGGVTGSPETLPVTVFPSETPMPSETLTLAPTETSTDLPTVETATITPSDTPTELSSPTENIDASVQIDETETTELSTETDVVESDTSTPMPTDTLTPEPTETPTSTSTPTETLTPTITIAPTETPITPTSTSTLTPFPTTLSQITPAVARANPNEDANLTITGIATSIDIDLNPVETQDSFRTGFRRLYFFIQFEGMATGVLWRWGLYREGEFVDGQPLLWGVPSEGETFFFVGDNLGFIPGVYEMRLYLGDDAEPINNIEFTVTN